MQPVSRRLCGLPARSALSILALALIGSGCAKTPDPRAAARAFYDEILRANPRGLPSEAEMRTLRPLVTRSLDTLIETARHARSHFEEQYPDGKPPWIEGHLFGSLFEGLREVSLEAPRIEERVEGTEARIPARAAWHAEGGLDTVRWTDTLLLRLEEGEWRVHDLRYGGDWAFRPGGGLREALSAEGP